MKKINTVQSASAQNSTDAKIVKVTVTKKGFEPSSIKVAAQTPVVLEVTRKTDSTCAKKISVADKREGGPSVKHAREDRTG